MAEEDTFDLVNEKQVEEREASTQTPSEAGASPRKRATEDNHDSAVRKVRVISEEKNEVLDDIASSTQILCIATSVIALTTLVQTGLAIASRFWKN